MESIHEIVRKAESSYVNNTTRLGKYVDDFSMHETIETITAYINSRHTTGKFDSLQREKPFFNIVIAAINIWYRATDIDRKDINVRATSSSNVIAAFLATVVLQEWMRRAKFGSFLNKWGRVLAQYGSAVVQFVEKGKELHASVPSWSRIICDPIDFDALPRIQKLYKTPAQLKNMATPGHPDYAHYDKAQVDLLCTDAETTRKTLDRTDVDTQNEFLEIYEVHGELPLCLLKEYGDTEADQEQKKLDEEIYRQQMHVVSFIAKEGTGDAKDPEYTDYSLYKGKERQDPMMLTHLIEEDGRTLSIGATEYLFDAQWMQNHSVKNMKDTLDFTSKWIVQTADSDFVGMNVLTDIETGDILSHAMNKPLTQLSNNKSADISALMNFQKQWQVLGQDMTSTPDALRGNTMPSGTAYSLGAYLGTQAGSLFEIMIENKGLHVEDMVRRFIIPHMKRTMLKDKKQIASILSDHNIKKIDAMWVPKEAVRRYNSQAKAALLEGVIPPAFADVQEQMESDVRKDLAPLGNQRFFDPEDIDWNKVLEDVEWELEIDISGENIDKRAALETLSTTLRDIAQNPTILTDPNARVILSKILSIAGGVSPAELTVPPPAQAPPAPGQATPQPQASGGGAPAAADIPA